MSRLYLIDGTALAYRSYFAFAGSSRGGLTTRSGRPTAAIYGFTMALRALLDREKPERIVVSFDGPRKDLARTRIYADYKSTRDKIPDELTGQLPDIRRIVELHGIPIVECPGHEADDVIATLAVQARDAGMEVFIVTGDKDFMQLVDERVKLWNLRSSTRDPEVIDAAGVEQRYGVRPAQMRDLLALMGDSSDNIPGVPRVGQKTAARLLADFATLDAALARLAEVEPPSLRRGLEEHRDQALLSRELVTLRTDVPLDLSVADLGPPQPDLDGLRETFRELEFDSLVRALPTVRRESSVPQRYVTVHDREELDALLTTLRSAGRFALDVETSNEGPMHAVVCGLSFCCEPGQAHYVPGNADPPVVEGGRAALLELLRPLLEDPALEKTLHDAKAACHALRNHGITLAGIAFDTMLASYCLSPGVGGHDLASLMLRYYDYEKIPKKELLGTGRRQRTFEDVDVEAAARYATEDVDFTARLRATMEPELESLGVAGVYRDIEMPLVPVLFAMEREGIRVDVDHLQRLAKRLGARTAELEDRIYQRAGEPFNLNSPSQIGEVLFGRLEVHRLANVRPKRTPTGQYKTDAAVLEKLAAHHEVPRMILEYRMLTKLKGGYVDSLPEMVHPRTGRIHTTFNQAVAATGRLSSDNPNLQNIPIRTEWGREVRRAFVSRAPGWVLLSADYSQIELRILAHVSGDPALIEAFRQKDDIHTRTAARVHGLLPGMVTPEMRNRAKVINYGLVYGMGASRLASETGMTPVEARKFIDAYFGAFPRVKEWLDATLAEARRERAVWTLFGRRRPLPDIDSTSVPMRVAAENMAVNTPIQGTAADIIKRAMLALHDELQRPGLEARLLLQVHDELVLDVPEDEVDEVSGIVRRCMADAAELSVPLEVAIGTGHDWLAAH